MNNDNNDATKEMYKTIYKWGTRCLQDLNSVPPEGIDLLTKIAGLITYCAYKHHTLPGLTVTIGPTGIIIIIGIMEPIDNIRLFKTASAMLNVPNSTMMNVESTNPDFLNLFHETLPLHPPTDNLEETYDH